ncbi:diguanylate cyclase [Oxalobacteraceae bacterium A2-2]
MWVPFQRLSRRLPQLCCLLLLLAGFSAQAGQQRKVLVLYSLGSDAVSVWQAMVRKGLDAELAGQDGMADVAVYEERLDAIRVGEQRSMDAMEPYLRIKYAETRFDTVITENYTAAHFLSERPGLFPGAARHYLNHGRPGWRPADGMGYDVPTGLSQSLAVIPRVMPGVRHIVVVGDRSPRVQEWIASIRAASTPYRERIQFEYWDNLSFEELYHQSGLLGEGTAVLLLAGYYDRNGARSRPVDIARRMAAVSHVPVFTNVESSIQGGVVGGYVTGGVAMGHALGRLLLGRQPDIAAIPHYVFDHAAFQRHGLRELDEPVAWLGQPRSIVRQHLWEIVLGAPLILAEAALIVALVRALRGRRQTTLALQAERSQLELHVLERTRELQAANDKLELLATTDPLTGIGNRRRMTEQINQELVRSRRSLHTLALLMVDIDHFKRINDRYGHESGDRAIVAVAQALAGGVRGADMASRFGGEEFVLLMPDTDLEVARQAAERLRMEVAALRIAGDKGEVIQLTISIGVAASNPSGPPDTASSLLNRADQALYRAKELGRDRVVCA